MLFADGRLHVEVEGLVDTASGVNPAPNGFAVVTCSSVEAARSATVPFSKTGAHRWFASRAGSASPTAGARSGPGIETTRVD